MRSIEYFVLLLIRNSVAFKESVNAAGCLCSGIKRNSMYITWQFAFLANKYETGSRIS